MPWEYACTSAHAQGRAAS